MISKKSVDSKTKHNIKKKVPFNLFIDTIKRFNKSTIINARVIIQISVVEQYFQTVEQQK